MTRPRGSVSAEALAWLRSGALGPEPDESLDLEGQRALRETYYRPASDAAVSRHGVQVRSIEYAGIPALRIDPPNPRHETPIMYLFGGGFVFGSPWQDMPIIAHLAAVTSRPVLAPFYRLAPENPFPAALDDCTRVFAQLLSEAPGGTALVGESAGGTLALGTANRTLATANGKLRALALISPATDQSDYGDSYLTARDPVLDPERVDVVPSLYAPNTDRRHPEVSPIYAHYKPGFPPTLITTGTRDLLLSNCVRLDRVLRDSGVESTLRVWEGMWHAFEFYADLPEARSSLDEIAGFLTTRLQD